jgi:5'-nucleotidase
MTNQPFSARRRGTLAAAIAMGAGLTAMSATTHALNVALSNDDGWTAPGIQAMKAALAGAGHTVTLAAPLDEQSGSSAAVNANPGDLLIVKQAEGPGVLEFSVATSASGGTEGAEPASSALVAISIAGEPDLLVTGINSGANIGSFAQISGTVGGAIVGLGSTFNQAVPSIAISTDEVCDPEDEELGPEEVSSCEAENASHYAAVAQFMVDFIAHLETKPGYLAKESALLPPGLGLNINYPPTDNVKGVKVSVQGRTARFGVGFPVAIQFGCYEDCANAPLGEPIPGGISGIEEDETTDVKNGDAENFERGYITIVPIEADYTAKSPYRFKSVVNSFNY